MSTYRPPRKQESAAEGQAAVPDAAANSRNGDEKITDAPNRGRVSAGPKGDDAGRVVNPDLTVREFKKGVRPGDVYVRRREPHSRYFKRVGPGHFVATEEAARPVTPFQRAYRSIKAILIGKPLENAQEIQERLGKFKALAVFSSDAISSVAYATGEIMFVLMLAGSAALGFTIPISFAIAILLFIVAFSYRQTIYAYPNGGGSYIVSLENVGRRAGLVAAAALLIDYILTVAVSISAGTDAITSAFPVLRPFTVELALVFVGIMTLINLRGVTESGSVFAIPTYTFILTLGGVIALGLAGALLGWYQPSANPVVHPVKEELSLFLILTAFSAGAVAMSGTEAISNGVPAFKPPESKNAARTLTVMAAILAFFFMSVSVLADYYRADPGSTETIISQLGRVVYGDSWVYYVFQFATMGILVVAANTAFSGFPRLASILARDNFMPHQFLFRGDRLAFSVGIAALGVVAGALILLFRGNTHALIPLYAIGVFLAFTLSQAGMVVHWRKLKTPGWKRSAIVNGVGALATAVILLVAAVTKFVHGAWIVMLLIPALVAMFSLVQRHYTRVAAQLRIVPGQLPPPTVKQFAIVPIESVNYASLRALAVARSMSAQVVALHVGTDTEHAQRVKERMTAYAPDINFVVLDSPYRQFVRPLMSYIEALHQQTPDAFVTIVLPEFIPAHWWERALHGRMAQRLRAAFETHPNVAVVLVPYLLED
ncbi:MAG: APC family permease [Chloroflexi bacterium]|nr:APC family permease [Chloroflexota bacterium]